MVKIERTFCRLFFGVEASCDSGVRVVRIFANADATLEIHQRHSDLAILAQQKLLRAVRTVARVQPNLAASGMAAHGVYATAGVRVFYLAGRSSLRHCQNVRQLRVHVLQEPLERFCRPAVQARGFKFGPREVADCLTC